MEKKEEGHPRVYFNEQGNKLQQKPAHLLESWRVLGTGEWVPAQPFGGGEQPPGSVSPAAWDSLLEHLHISAKLFSASP